MVSVSVAESLLDAGSVVPAGAVTEAVLSTGVLAVWETLTVAEKVTEVPAARLTSCEMLPLPEAAQEAPAPDGVQVHVAPVSEAGKVSVTVAPVTSEGPLLLT